LPGPPSVVGSWFLVVGGHHPAGHGSLTSHGAPGPRQAFMPPGVQKNLDSSDRSDCRSANRRSNYVGRGVKRAQSGVRRGAPVIIRHVSPVEVQFTSAGVPNYPCRTLVSRAESVATRVVFPWPFVALLKLVLLIGRHGAYGLARRLWKADCRRNREVGQGSPICRHQGGLSRQIFHISRSAKRRVAALHHCFGPYVRSGSVRDAKACPRWRQLSPKAGTASLQQVSPRYALG
jgi:hypothetical protein